jgi:hypothetical protein
MGQPIAVRVGEAFDEAARLCLGPPTIEVNGMAHRRGRARHYNWDRVNEPRSASGRRQTHLSAGLEDR